MIKVLISLSSFLVLTGCGACERKFTNITGGLTSKCHEGVKYLQSDSGLTVALDLNGKPLPCKE